MQGDAGHQLSHEADAAAGRCQGVFQERHDGTAEGPGGKGSPAIEAASRARVRPADRIARQSLDLDGELGPTVPETRLEDLNTARLL